MGFTSDDNCINRYYGTCNVWVISNNKIKIKN